MAHAISDEINPNRLSRSPFGLKSESTLNRLTLNPSSPSPGETLYINIPKLSDGMLIVPNTVYLIFDLTVDGHANRTLVNNLGQDWHKETAVALSVN